MSHTAGRRSEVPYTETEALKMRFSIYFHLCIPETDEPDLAHPCFEKNKEIDMQLPDVFWIHAFVQFVELFTSTVGELPILLDRAGVAGLFLLLAFKKTSRKLIVIATVKRQISVPVFRKYRFIFEKVTSTSDRR